MFRFARQLIAQRATSVGVSSGKLIALPQLIMRARRSIAACLAGMERA